MLRRTLLFALMATCLTGLANRLHAEETKRPNILFAFADDWGKQASIYGQLEPGGINDVVKTPHFDALAKRGVLFKNAFVNAPSCTPCRSSLLSGQYFWRTGRGAILRGAVWDPTIPSYPLLLRDAGYHIGETYKVWSPGTPVDAPYGSGKYAYQKAGGSFNQFSQRATALMSQGKSTDDAKQELYQQVRGNFSDFLKDRKEGQPFCYWFGPTNVHRKWIAGSGKKLWGINPDDLKGKMPAFLPDVPVVRQDLADYLGEIQAFDAALGILVEQLKEAGELDNTLIVVSGDHGPPGFPQGKCNLYDFGTHVALAVAGPGVNGGRVVDDFTILPDLAPTFLEAGGEKIPEVMTAKSLWPVLKSDQEGLVDPTRTAAFTGRERHVEMAREGNLPYPMRGIQTADYQLIINFKPDRWPMGDPYNLGTDNPPTLDELVNKTFVTFPDDDAGPTKAFMVMHRADPEVKPIFDRCFGKRSAVELYDLKSDPDQMTNVADDPKYEKVKEELTARLMEELKTSGDPRVIDNGKFFETPPMAGPLTGNGPKPNRKR
ncbi:sulfatase family protein [Bremerella sp. P1]|uniref:sulfatase family protein n=1 Tax=Bremerella sp. P1 TaxID=3026424 RepID=UPI0023681A9F|nr:sulfatase [Bremerella sp. P1]WDI44286.1 sulfatase [Bremerella sp. P1]